jgi:hypothetical protein
MPVGAKMVVVFKAGVEHGVLFVLGHGFVFAFVVVAQTDVFHRSFPSLVLPRTTGSESRSTSFCYQVVVRETEDRQQLHFFISTSYSLKRKRARNRSAS